MAPGSGALTQTFHRKAYPAISPTLPALSQAGRTVLVTGASGGVGFAIAKGFILASASRLVILGRNLSTLDNAAKELKAAAPAGSNTEVVTIQHDAFNTDGLDGLWEKLKNDSIVVDILVLNAADGANIESLTKEWKRVWTMFESNVLANLRMTEKFFDQGPEKGKVSHSAPVTPGLTYRPAGALEHFNDAISSLSSASFTEFLCHH